MAYTKYSLTPADNNAAPPNGAPEGMLPSAVNDTMRDMMSQIRDVGDGIRGGTYTMTAPVITGGSITGVALSGNTLTNPVITGGAISTSTLTGNTFTNPVISGGSINNTPIGATTPNTGAFTTLSATGVTTVQAGTVSAPAITTTGDTNTGIFFPAADTIAFSEGGAEVARFDANGNFGIGLTPVSYRLSTNVASGDNTFGQYVAGTLYGYLQTSSSYVKVGTNAATPVIVETNGTERMRIDSSGRLLVNTTTANAQMCLNYAGNSIEGFRINDSASSSGSAAVRFQFGGTGVGGITLTGSTTTYATSSDYRLKENIAPMTGALGLVQQLKPVTYNWKVDGSASQGFIAHELQAVVPDCVTGEKDAVDEEGKPVYQGIDTSFLVATLTCAIQELKAELNSVKAELATLKA